MEDKRKRAKNTKKPEALGALPTNTRDNSFASLHTTNLKEIAGQVERENRKDEANQQMRKIQSGPHDRGRPTLPRQGHLPILGTISSASSPESVPGKTHLQNADKDGYESIGDHRVMQDVFRSTQSDLMKTIQK